METKKDRYKCFNCFLIFEETEMEDELCPGCQTSHLLKKLCKNDPGVCKCALDTHPNVILCPICNDPICPECGSHDVVGVSRVTGYLSDVSGWRNSKKAEFKDRQRYNMK